MSTPINVVRTGVANIGSMVAGLKRAGGDPVLIDDAETIRTARHVVVPGVGTFGEAMQSLHDAKLVDALKYRFENGLPTLFVCVGLQILGSSSEESPNASGFGFLPSHVIHFPAGVHVPQQGWNKVDASQGSFFLHSGFAYYSNSFCFVHQPVGDSWASAVSDHGTRFIAAVERGGFLACQFHPELSGDFGQAILKKWIDHAPSRVLKITQRAFFFLAFTPTQI